MDNNLIECVWKFIKKNPDLVYKGVPIAIGTYFVSPIAYNLWQWLPWIWTSYQIIKRIPSEWIYLFYNNVYSSVNKVYKEYNENYSNNTNRGSSSESSYYSEDMLD